MERKATAGGFRGRDLRIAADLAMLKHAREWAAQAAEDFGLGEDERFQVKLAASEAVTNAILHGSGSGGDAVELAVRAERGALVFEVSDCGGDAPPDRVERLDAGGRGLEMVALVMDEVELTRRGTGSVLRFAKRPAAA